MNVFFSEDMIFFSKKKLYDGSDTLKMIGNDCLTLESNASALLEHILNDGETFDHAKSKDIRHCALIYKLFADVAR